VEKNEPAQSGKGSCLHKDEDHNFGQKLTIIATSLKLIALVVDPRVNIHEIGDKRRDLAFDDRGISTDHVLLDNFCFVELIDNCLVKELKPLLAMAIGTWDTRSWFLRFRNA
jgi:hypothetical protein